MFVSRKYLKTSAPQKQMFEPSLPNRASTLVTILKMGNSGDKAPSP
jgi:hypothetical protein